LTNNVLEFRQQSNITFQLLIRSQCEDHIVDIKKTHILSIDTSSLQHCHCRQVLQQTDKSKVFHHLIKDVENLPSLPEDKTLVIEDDNAVFY
jgi:hypothetical protein